MRRVGILSALYVGGFWLRGLGGNSSHVLSYGLSEPVLNNGENLFAYLFHDRLIVWWPPTAARLPTLSAGLDLVAFVLVEYMLVYLEVGEDRRLRLDDLHGVVGRKRSRENQISRQQFTARLCLRSLDSSFA